MMASLVDQYVADEMLEFLAILDPFVEDRAAEQADPVGQLARCIDALLADRNAFIDAGQVERMIDPHLGQQLGLGQFIDLQDDIAQVGRKRLGQALQRGARDRLDLVG